MAKADLEVSTWRDQTGIVPQTDNGVRWLSNHGHQGQRGRPVWIAGDDGDALVSSARISGMSMTIGDRAPDASIERRKRRAFYGTFLPPLAIGAAVGLYIFANANQPPPPPSAEEIKAGKEAAAEAKFDAKQRPLWALPAASITFPQFQREMRKCKTAAEGEGQPAIYWATYDAPAAHMQVRGGMPWATLIGQRRVPIGDVQWAEYTCHFEGSGFSFVTSKSVGYTKGFVAE